MAPQTRQGSPLHKEVRASQTLTKVLGRVTHQPNKGVDHPPSPAVSNNSVGLGRLWAPEIDHAAMPGVLPHATASDQALPSPRSLTMTRKQAVNPNSPTRRRTSPVKMRMQRPARVKLRF